MIPGTNVVSMAYERPRIFQSAAIAHRLQPQEDDATVGRDPRALILSRR
jgi:hypothetical protein